MDKIRGFEVITAYQQAGLTIPQRATLHAAGYDFEAAEDVLIPSLWQAGLLSGLEAFLMRKSLSDEEEALVLKKIKPTLVPTGIKAYMGDEEFLQLCNRSSNPLKLQMILANGVGIIDSDYYDNPDNEGHIMFQFVNYGLKDVLIQKGQRIGQGIFMPYLLADQDAGGAKRTGGFGSSGK